MTKPRRSLRALMAAGGGLALLAGSATAMAAAIAPAHTTLRVASDVVIPHASGSHQFVTAEASDGVVAIAVPQNSTTDHIELASGGHQPAVFENVPSGTVAMAFSDTDLFVAGPHAIGSFSRSTGAVIRTWNVRVAATPGAAGAALRYDDGRLWALGSDGHGRQVIEIDPANAGLTAVGSAKNVFSIAAGPRGVYFVRNATHRVVRVAANGTRTAAPTHEKVNAQLSGPAALQAIGVDGATLLVVHDAGQGFDASLVRYGAHSLKHLSAAGTDVTHADVVPTADGDLAVIASDVSSGCAHASAKACVARILPKTAKVETKVRLPAGVVRSALVGPEPAIVIGHHGHAHLVRLS